MQLSIGKLAGILIALLIAVTVVTTSAGIYVLQANYRSLEDRHHAEAQDTVHNAAIAVQNQLQFYQGILRLLSSNANVSNLLEFGDTDEIMNWSFTIGRLLPGSIGTALASNDGVVFGDPLALRVGPACQRDMHNYADNQSTSYPVLHTDVIGLEHFDLVTDVMSPSGDKAGSLFVSFRISVIKDLLQSMTHAGDRFLLLDGAGNVRLSTGPNGVYAEPAAYREQIPQTNWTLMLERPVAQNNSMLRVLIAIDLLVLASVALLVVSIIRKMLAGFETDLLRVRSALTDVLNGRYRPSDAPTAIREANILLPDIERLALNIQHQRDELRRESLSDPLTGVYNRRYFDLMLAHLHQQSRRQPPAVLLLIDLNDFKKINDELGHPEGDRVLKNVANYLAQKVRASDIVARLGGDEFAVLLTHMASTSLDDWLTILIHDYDHQLMISNRESTPLCQFSVGASLIDAAVYATPAEVFNAADRAMYRVKQRRNVHHSRFEVSRATAAALASAQLL